MKKQLLTLFLCIATLSVVDVGAASRVQPDGSVVKAKWWQCLCCKPSMDEVLGVEAATHVGAVMEAEFDAHSEVVAGDDKRYLDGDGRSARDRGASLGSEARAVLEEEARIMSGRVAAYDDECGVELPVASALKGGRRPYGMPLGTEPDQSFAKIFRTSGRSVSVGAVPLFDEEDVEMEHAKFFILVTLPDGRTTFVDPAKSPDKFKRALKQMKRETGL